MATKLKNKTVFVGVSGGVDSSVSAALLKDQGYNVVGVFIRTWQPDFIECSWRDERRDAMRVCAHLDIPFLECDAEEAYKSGVADYMIEEYKKGNTPNPDVMCNREVKFGVFWNFAKAHGADYIATGHYACANPNSFREVTGGGVPLQAQANNGVKELREKLFELKRSPDLSKDQSYFLWTLTQDDLSHTLFPVGHLQKSKVRILAEKYNLPTATKKDSQGVCFLGPLDMKDFLAHYIDSKKGNVKNIKGEIIGTHDGVLLYTLGERHGFKITQNSVDDKPYYIVAKDIPNNVLIVSNNKDEYKDKNKDIRLERIVMRCPVENDKTYTAQIRYHGVLLDCKVKVINQNVATVIFNQGVLVDKGQSIVIYDKDVCIGGGIVK